MSENSKKNTELSLAERFTMSVEKSWADVAKGIELTENEKSLIANYFIEIDKALKNSKQNYNWGHVRMNELALTLAHTAKLGIDMSLPNMLSFIPFKYGDTGTINLVPVKGKGAYEFIAKKFGIDPPVDSLVELVYSTDNFKVIKRDANHEHDDYIFEVTNPFDRGDVIGAFGVLYFNDPSKTKVMMKSIKELESYRPPRYDQTFWTGENRLKMLEKTMAKQLFKTVTLDPEKVNKFRSDLDFIDNADINSVAEEARNDIDQNLGTGEFIDTDFEEVNGAETQESIEEILCGENEEK